MATNIGMPECDVKFKGLGMSAIKRGKSGNAVLILRDDTPGKPKDFYKSVEDLNSEEASKFTPANLRYIKDAMEGIPLALYVFKIAEDGDIAAVLKKIGGKIPSNSWIATADSAVQNELIPWVKAKNKMKRKRFKVFAFNAVGADDMHVVNFTNTNVTWADERGEVPGNEVVPYLMGFLAGIRLSASAIAFDLPKFKTVDDYDEEEEKHISNGEFVLFNDEGMVKVARGVNSLVTLGGDLKEEMCFINTVEKMDLIYCDIVSACSGTFKGSNDNDLDNQMLVIGSINSYFGKLAMEKILDPNFHNHVDIDVERQRLENIPKYGEDKVNSWDDAKVRTMTISTKVFFKSNIKITGIMEDFYIPIYM